MPSRSLSELAKLTGMKPRTLQFWAASGAIIPEEGTKHGGPGVHRKYPQAEVEIACVLAAISSFNLQVGALIAIANKLREISCFFESTALTIDEIEDRYYKEHRRRQLVLRQSFDEEKRRISESLDLHNSYNDHNILALTPIDDETYARYDMVISINDARTGEFPTILRIAVDDAGVIIRLSGEGNAALFDRYPATLEVRLDKVLPKAS